MKQIHEHGTKRIRTTPFLWTAAALLGILLCACGSGSGSGTAAVEPVKEETITEPAPEETKAETAAASVTDESGTAASEKVTSASAAEMRLVRMVGAVSLRNAEGNPLSKKENMRLDSGNEISTAMRSRAGVSLDDTKAVTVGEQSLTVLEKEERLLNLKLKSGEMYFSVSEPLESDESFNIQTSTMVMGIRGTSGYVSALGEDSCAVILTSGHVEISAVTGETQSLDAGQRAIIRTGDAGTEFQVERITAEEYPTLLLEELAADEGMLSEVSEQTEEENLYYIPAMEAYRRIIANAESYEFMFPNFGSATDTPDTLTGVYLYAYEKIRPGDPVPALLLKAPSTFGIDSIRVFYYEPSTGELIAPDEMLEEGVGSAGGFRGSIGLMEDGSGFRETGISSGTGQGEINRVTLTGDNLSREYLWSGNMFTENVPDIGYREIVWHERSEIEEFKGNIPAGLPTDGNRTVLRGTVRIVSYYEMLEIQGVRDPNPGDHSNDSMITVIILDGPQQITAYNVDRIPSTREVSMIKIYRDDLSPVNGKEVIFSMDPEKISWPSDTSLPLGEPYSYDVHILN